MPELSVRAALPDLHPAVLRDEPDRVADHGHGPDRTQRRSSRAYPGLAASVETVAERNAWIAARSGWDTTASANTIR